MKKTFLAIAIASAFTITSCNQQAKQENTEQTGTEITAPEATSQTLTDSKGNTLEMTFDNAKDMVTVKFAGEIAELASQQPASGIWYKNEQYELRGKGNDIELTKDGTTVFEHKDDKVETEAKNDKGDVLKLVFNNTQGTLKAYLNGGEQIDLVQQISGSGIRYKNDDYELIGKGNQYELIHKGETLFEN